MASPHTFTAYIDEAGDEGFKFREPPHNGSSPWFILSAVVIRTRNDLATARQLNEVFKPIELRHKKYLHFSELCHEERVPVAHVISKAPVKLISVCIHKTALTKEHGLAKNRRMYFWATRLLLERISWLTRDSRERGDPKSNKCGLVFSHCRKLSYGKLREYLALLHTPLAEDVRIEWDYLSTDDLEVLAHHERIGLKVADAVASGLRYALDLSPHGFCEDRYVRLFKPVTYCRGPKYLGYGLKVLPSIPPHEPHRDFRYRWIAEYG